MVVVVVRPGDATQTAAQLVCLSAARDPGSAKRRHASGHETPQNPGMFDQDDLSSPLLMLSVSCKRLLVSSFQCNLKVGTGSQPSTAVSYPELPEELMRISLVIMTARAHDARIAAHPADSGVRCKLPGQALGVAAAGAGRAAPPLAGVG